MSRKSVNRAVNVLNGFKKNNIPSANEMILPNHSGDHVRSIKRAVPVADVDLVNKSYVDLAVAGVGYTDAQAVAAVATADDYVKLIGDVMSGSLEISAGAHLRLFSGNAFQEINIILDHTDGDKWEMQNFGDSALYFVYNDTNFPFWIGALGDINVMRNIIVGGTVDGIDIAGQAVFVTANSNHRVGDGSDHADVATNTLKVSYTDAAAVAAVATADDYLKNDGDTASGDYNFCSNTLSIDDSSDKVGVGIAVPNSKLHVHSSDTATYFQITNPTTGAVGHVGFQIAQYQNDSIIMNRAKGPMKFKTNNTYQMSILAGGNVGIGTQNPASKLQVSGAISSGTKTITASADDTDVSGVNTLFINPAAAVVIGGFAGGVDGQVLHVIIVDGDQTVTLENEEADGTQKLAMHESSDETLTSKRGGFTFVYNSVTGFWHDVSHARHV